MGKYLYHGSPKRLEGKFLLPKRADDLNKNPDNLHKAIYATDIKEDAISMAIVSCDGVSLSSLDLNKKPHGIIYEGWPKQDYFFLYSIFPKTFTKSIKIKHQFISKEPIKPIKIEKLKVKDYLHLVRKATKKSSR